MTSWLDLFDAYSLRARLYPALLTVLPIALLVVGFGRQAVLTSALTLLVSFGGMFFLANFVRSRGKRLQKSLVEEWKGMPTTHLLRDGSPANPVLTARWRRRLEEFVDEPLPTATEERDDPSLADARYVSAIRLLISRVRDRADVFPRVQEENTNFGFRRNLLALKPFALTILVASLVADAVIGIVTRDLLPISLIAVVHIIVFLAWQSVVTSQWVYEQGCVYAERLLETLDSNRLE